MIRNGVEGGDRKMWLASNLPTAQTSKAKKEVSTAAKDVRNRALTLTHVVCKRNFQ
jgi:hypothetical protein